MKSPDWQIDNYKQMHLLRAILLVPILIMFSLVFYRIASDHAGVMNTTIIFIFAIPAILPLFIISPEYVQIGVKDDLIFVNRRHILYPKKSARLNIPGNQIKSTRIEKKDSLFNSKLVLAYTENASVHHMIVPLINFNLSSKKKLIRHIHSIAY